MPGRREMPACALGKIPQGVNSRAMCCWGKLQTSLSIPAPCTTSLLSEALPGRILGVPSPRGPFSSLPTRSSQHPEAGRGVTPP